MRFLLPKYLFYIDKERRILYNFFSTKNLSAFSSATDFFHKKVGFFKEKCCKK